MVLDRVNVMSKNVSPAEPAAKPRSSRTHRSLRDAEHTPTEPRPAGTQTIETAMQVLLALADMDRPIGVTEIARKLNLHKSTVSRQLAMLKVADFVSQDSASSRYRLGLGLLPLAANVLSAHRLSGVARLRLEGLARATRETITHSGWDGQNAINLDQFGRGDPSEPFAPPGRVNPAHCTASGKAFLAELSPEALARRIDRPLARLTDQTITDPTALRAEIELVRQSGLAFNRSEFIPDTYSIATLVRPQDGSRTYGIAITLPSRRAGAERLEELGAELIAAARDLAQAP